MITPDGIGHATIGLILLGGLLGLLALAFVDMEPSEPPTLCERLAVQDPAFFDLEDCERRVEVSDSLAAVGK